MSLQLAGISGHIFSFSAEQHTTLGVTLTELQHVQVPTISLKSPERAKITAEICSFPEASKQTQILAKPPLVLASGKLLK